MLLYYQILTKGGVIIELRNYTEILVENNLDKIMKKSDVCNCEKCRADITALALNDLKPQYVVSEKGECFAKLSILENQTQINVISAIIKAIEVVSSNPRHNTGA